MDNSIKKILVATIIASTTYILIKQYFKYKNAYEFWKKLGVKTPKIRPIIGHMYEVFFGDLNTIRRNWYKQYGPCYGLYQGAEPHLVILDPEIIQQILVKDFDIFPGSGFDTTSNKILKSTVLFLEGDDWKRVRTLVSPSFTPAKIKHMYKLLADCSHDVLNELNHWIALNGTNDILINGRDFASLYTIDTICTCCYGLRAKTEGAKSLKQAAKTNQLIESGLLAFKLSTIGILSRVLLPTQLCDSLGLDIFPTKNQEPIQAILKSVVEARRRIEAKLRPSDPLQLMIDARSDSIKDSRAESYKISSGISDQEILGQAVFLLLAGLETSSILVSQCLYTLAHLEYIQNKLFQDLTRLANKDENGKMSFDYDALMSYDYLDAFISEILRYFSIASDFRRIANQDYHIKKFNLTIPKGMIVDIQMREITHDPKYWSEPEKFLPERFSANNKHQIVPGSYIPFGMGPRQCLGVRFAITEVKLFLSELLLKYQLNPAPNTSFPPEQKFVFPFYSLVNPIVKITKRDIN